MLLRDFLNEFELDWAQAAVRSGQIPQRSLKGARILLAGDQMELQEGEVLAVHFEAVRGSMCTGIQAPDGSSLYQGNGKGVTEFTVNIHESGTYPIFVEAHHAKGTVSIQQKVQKVEKKDAR